MSVEFDPEDWQTWPIPKSFVLTRGALTGLPRRLTPQGDGWVEGFETALRMADHYFRHNEWDVDA